MTRCDVLCCVVLRPDDRVEPDPTGSKDTCILVFSAGPPYEDIAFRIVNKEWETTQRWVCKGWRGGACLTGRVSAAWHDALMTEQRALHGSVVVGHKLTTQGMQHQPPGGAAAATGIRLADLTLLRGCFVLLLLLPQAWLQVHI